jgi:hypothetical protein
MKFRNLILILFELIKFNHMKKIAKCTVQMGCVYSSSVHPDRRGTTHLSCRPKTKQGRVLGSWHMTAAPVGIR